MKYIDVTIRESVYLKQGMTEKKALEYLAMYEKIMPFDEIKDLEICFLDNIGTGMLNYNEEYINSAWEIVNKRFGLVAVIHSDKVDLEKWNPEVIKKFRTVRFMVNKKIDKHAEEVIDYLHNLGVRVSINVIYISRKDREFIDECIEIAEKHRVEDFCLADSCGNCLPERVLDDVLYLRKRTKGMLLNYHFHDHFGTAMANALICYKKLDMLDCSLFGIGKGGGNLCMEKIILAGRIMDGKSISTEELVAYANLLKFLIYNILEEDWNYASQMYENLLIGVFNRNLKEIQDAQLYADGNFNKMIERICNGK